ncbi:flagellar basal body L-ring protein FlgH [Marinomonas posidonica]|uniref:Flagellar L-ring protein n=1 Tax=Marinomonas posidonica (strain CECT 7376 / NCIMB 14433 / IVIA-Po-181) TaxID=491952 RepID=F6CZL3_MARPP|nr:flagellar basal body L-ring protein FlgH [Marinomonas posidonica]AEF55825.1 Flagellar L-ring protein [Marinomonas posidonica IVIA-Po-181]
MKIKLFLLASLSFCLTGCLTWDIDQQAVANAAAAGAAGAVADAVVDAVTDEDDDASEDTPAEEDRKGFVPDPNDPLNGPEVTEAIQQDDPYYTPIYDNGMGSAQAPTGGIYQAGMGDVFFGDQKASKVGDILTINLNETTTSNKANGATVSKSSSATIENPTVLGQELRMDTTLPQQGTDFSGNASANQNNSLSGTITVTVYKAYSNGLLAVRGEKWLRLNQGDEYIRFSGLVRKQDISPDNTVESQRVADARITYSGTGEVAAGSEQGWVSRLLNTRDMPY